MSGRSVSLGRNHRRIGVVLATSLVAGVVALGAIGVVAPNSASATETAPHPGGCKPYDFVGVRASGEPQGFGVTIGPLYQDFAATVGTGQVAKYALVYPAVGQPIDNKSTTIKQFFASVDTGTTNLQAYLNHQISFCPSQEIVVAGWSQGATVVDRALQGLPAEAANHIVGVTLFGDPRFNPNFAGDAGTFDPGRRGIFRLLMPWYGGEQYVANGYTNDTQSYCVAGDPVCNYSFLATYHCLNSVTRPSCPHGQYESDGYVEQAADYLAGRL